jgi:hypothetical protein
LREFSMVNEKLSTPPAASPWPKKTSPKFCSGCPLELVVFLRPSYSRLASNPLEPERIVSGPVPLAGATMPPGGSTNATTCGPEAVALGTGRPALLVKVYVAVDVVVEPVEVTASA